MVDSSVRLTWELNRDEFRLTNPAWPEFLDIIKQDAAHSLGLSPLDIDIEPYKLLLYEKGSFFKPHRDSEKAPGMVGSLVVCLPSKHQGGQVHLSHAGKDHVHATGPNSAFDLTALAWYSDVTHEVKEVTAGHRLVLTYNINQRAGPGISAGFFMQQQAQLREKIARWSSDFPDLSKLVYFLDHKYSQSSLTQDNLKGRDRAVFQVLQHIGFEDGYYVLLSNVTKTEWDKNYYSDGPDITLEHLCSPEGRVIAATLEMSEEDIIGPDPYSNRPPDSRKPAEFTGNESMPAEKRYHDSALVLIPREELQGFIRKGADPWAMITIVMTYYRKCPDNADVRRHMLNVMHKVLDSHRPATGRYGRVPTAMRLWDSIRTTILTTGWKLRDIPLYHKATRACADGGAIPGDLVAKLASFVNRISSTQRLDWDKCLGGLLDCPVNLTCLFKALSDFENALENEAFRDSFRAWVGPIRRTKFESKPRLVLEDHDFIIDLVTSSWSDRGWVEQHFIRKLHQCGDKYLIREVIFSLAGKGHANTLPGAEAVAEQILNTELPRLYLLPVNWSAYPDGKESAELDRFNDLIGGCLQYGFRAQAASLTKDLDKITRSGVGGLVPNPAHQSVPNVAHQFVLALGNLLNVHQAPFMESVRGVFECLLRNYALAPCPVYPTRSDGWAHQPRGCGRNCALCEELDDFLVSPVRQTAEFAVASNTRAHFSLRLMGDLFTCATISRPGRKSIMVVTKRSQDGEHRAAVAAYEERIRVLRRYTEDFRQEHFRKILGDELYRELILLESPPGPGVPGASDRQHAAPGGIKREAGEELAVPPAIRRRVD